MYSTWVSPHFLFAGCFSALRLHVSHLEHFESPVLLFARSRRLLVVCFQMNEML